MSDYSKVSREHRKNNSATLGLLMGNDVEMNASTSTQTSKGFSACSCENLKPGVLQQSEIKQIYKDLRRALKIIFEVNAIKQVTNSNVPLIA